MQPHLGKCFDGIRRLEFGGDDPKSPDILAMVSAEGEKVPLGKNLKVCYPCSTCWLASTYNIQGTSDVPTLLLQSLAHSCRANHSQC